MDGNEENRKGEQDIVDSVKGAHMGGLPQELGVLQHQCGCLHKLTSCMLISKDKTCFYTLFGARRVCVYRSSKASCFTCTKHLCDSECGCIILKNIYKCKHKHVRHNLTAILLLYCWFLCILQATNLRIMLV